MKFFGTYGCSAVDSIYNIAIEARDEQSALKFCYDYAVEDRDSYEGFHGIKSWVDIAEDEGFTVGEMSQAETDYIDDLYSDSVESDIIYDVVPFDIDNEEHLKILKEQECEFWQAQKERKVKWNFKSF